MRARTSSFSSSMPRSVGTKRAELVGDQAALDERRRHLFVDPAGRDAFEDAHAQEHLLEVGVGGLEVLLSADREFAALDALHVLLGRAGVPPAVVVAVGVRARAEAQVRAGAPSSRGCDGTRIPAWPSSRPRSAGSRRRASARRPRANMSACRSGSGSGVAPLATARPSGVAGSIGERVGADVLGRERRSSRAASVPRNRASRRSRRRSGRGSRCRSRRRGRRRTPRARCRASAAARATPAPPGRTTARPSTSRSNPAPRSARRRGFVDGVGVRLRGDLGVRRPRRTVSRRWVSSDREVGRRLHRGRRAAAEEHARDLAPVPRGRRERGLGHQRPQVARLPAWSRPA